MTFIASIAVAEALSGLTCFHGEPGRERVGNARTRRRDRRDIGPLLVAPALTCGGSERAKQLQIGIAHTRPRLKEDREQLPLSSQWLGRCAVGMKQRVRGISGLPCPSQEQGNRYCDVLMASQSVSLSVAHFAPHRAKCAQTNPSESLSQGRQMTMRNRPMNANDNRRPKEAA